MPKSVAKKAKKKASKYVSVARARRLKIRYYKRKYRKHSSKKRFKHRMKKYHKKVSGVYKNRSYVGIKWTRYLSLSEFLIDDKWDLQWAYTLPYLAENKVFAGNLRINEYYQTQLKQITTRTLGIFSTDLWATRCWQMPAGEQNMLYYKAYAPVPSYHNLGPMFNVYRNMYKKWKYVGLKVKWTPGQKAVTQFLPATKATATTIGYNTSHPQLSKPYQFSVAAETPVADAVSYTLMDEVNVLNIKEQPNPLTFQQANTASDQPHFYTYPNDNYLTHSSYLPLQQSPMNLRLWINFDKMGYESYDLYQYAMSLSTGASMPETLQPNSRFRFRRVFDDSGNKKNVDTSLIRSYSLTKPFKFFVRPRLSSMMLEQPENETLQRNAEPNTIKGNQLKQWAMQNQSLIKTNLKMPYVSVMDTYAPDALGYSPANITSKDELNGQIYMSTSSDSCFDPILFGWGLSCDNLPLRKQIDFFKTTKINAFTPGSTLYHCNWIVDLPDEYRSYGKFKVTYYARFKGFSPIQQTQDIQRDNAIGLTDDSKINPIE